MTNHLIHLVYDRVDNFGAAQRCVQADVDIGVGQSLVQHMLAHLCNAGEARQARGGKGETTTESGAPAEGWTDVSVLQLLVQHCSHTSAMQAALQCRQGEVRHRYVCCPTAAPTPYLSNPPAPDLYRHRNAQDRPARLATWPQSTPKAGPACL